MSRGRSIVAEPVKPAERAKQWKEPPAGTVEKVEKVPIDVDAEEFGRHCQQCQRRVKGGDAGWEQHIRSVPHVSMGLWASGRFKNWEECRHEAKKKSQKLWEICSFRDTWLSISKDWLLGIAVASQSETYQSKKNPPATWFIALLAKTYLRRKHPQKPSTSKTNPEAQTLSPNNPHAIISV